MEHLTVLTYNVCHSRWTLPGMPWTAFAFENRENGIVDLVKSVGGADVLMFQEIPNARIASFLDKFDGYRWITAKEPSRGGDFTSLAVGLGRKLDPSMSQFITSRFFEDGGNGGALKVSIPHNRTVIVCVHLSTGPARLDAGGFLSSLVADGPDPDRLIVAGDFNSFPDRSGGPQMTNANHRLGTYSASEFARYATTGNLATKSFWPYPFDYVPRSALDTFGKLDHILVRGLECVDSEVLDNDAPNRNWKPSDHMPVVARLCYQ